MSKLLVVIGATGAQGGSIARIMSSTPGWTVRGVTRNPNSDSAKKLANDCPNIEIVTANLDDEDSLVKAFAGAQAVFGVTNFWEHLFTSNTPAKAGDNEVVQAMNLARAASKTKSLEHYIWSTLPPASKLTNGKFPIPHFDYKAEADEKIKTELPELAAKTTYLVFGYYATNMVYIPMNKPVPMPFPGKNVWMMPTSSSTPVSLTGDMSKNPGVWVRQILANPQKTYGKYLSVSTDYLSLGEMLEIWSEVSGKPASFLQVTPKQYEEIFGIAGAEIASQMLNHEVVTDWDAHRKREGTFVPNGEIGIRNQDVIGFKSCLEGHRDLL